MKLRTLNSLFFILTYNNFKMPKRHGKDRQHKSNSTNKSATVTPVKKKTVVSQERKSFKSLNKSVIKEKKPFLSQRINASKDAKDYTIKGMILTKNRQFEYIGECQESSKVVYFTRQKALENNLFPKILTFYRQKIQNMVKINE